jgi:hypothetical protein
MEGIYATVFLGEGADAGNIGMVLRGAPITEYDGDIVPGVRLSPEAARSLASDLYIFADKAESA